MQISKQDIDSILSEFSGQENYLAFPRVYVGVTGDVETALLLSQLLYWHRRSKTDWVYKTYSDWEDELGLNEYKVRRSRKKLESMGMLETKLKKANGSPTVHYRLNNEIVRDSIIRYCKNCRMESVKNEESLDTVKSAESLTEIPSETPSENSENPSDSSIKNDVDKKQKTDHQRIIDYFYDNYRIKTGEPPTVDGPYLKAVQSLLRQHGYETIRERIDRFFSGDYWFTKSGYSIKTFRARFDDLTGAPEKGEDIDEGVYTV